LTASRLANRLLHPLCLCLALLGAGSGLTVNAEEVAVPALHQRVTDLTGTLSASQQATLEAKLTQFEQQKGSQLAVLIVPTTQPEAIEQYSMRVVEAWKLGREKEDDGVLVLVAKNDKKMRIEVGYGLEGAIPDAYAKRIVSDIMAPHFRQGDFYGGIDAAIDSIIKLVDGEQLPPPPPRASRQQHDWGDLFPVLLIGGLVIGGILRAVLGRFLGGIASGGLIGALVWILGGGLIMALVLAIIGFFLTLLGVSSLGGLTNFGGGGGWSSGGDSPFSGGGGGFGGGGASGDW